jgi:hypothetical protein
VNIFSRDQRGFHVGLNDFGMFESNDQHSDPTTYAGTSKLAVNQRLFQFGDFFCWVETLWAGL